MGYNYSYMPQFQWQLIVEVMAPMSNYIPVCMDVITYPCPNPDAV